MATKIREDSLKGVLTKYRIEIPALQREYAQGRDNDRAKAVRELFLSSFKKVLDHENEKLSLDFSFGKLSEKGYEPVDGQQRLTTLFLLYAYFYRGMKEDVSGFLKNFSYEARSKAKDFLEELITKHTVVPNPSVWHASPSAEGMAVTFKAIDDKFRTYNKKDALDRLEKIKIMLVEDENLPDDIFCKMNSRGRTLTASESFKAAMIRLKTEENKGDLQKFIEGFDNFYDRLFKNKRVSEGNPGKCIDYVEFTIMHIIKCYFAFIEKIKLGNKSDKIKIDKYVPSSDYEFIINPNNKKDIKLDDLLPLAYFFQYFATSEKNLDEALQAILPKRHGKEKMQCAKLEQNKTAALVLGFGCVSLGNEGEIKRWMRVACNILDNSPDTEGRRQLLCKLSKESSQICSYLSHNIQIKDLQGSDKWDDELTATLQEEIDKAKEITNPNSYITEEEIRDAENIGFANGAIRYLYRDKDGNVDWIGFEVKKLNFKALFDGDGTMSKPPKDLIRFYIPLKDTEVYNRFFFNTRFNGAESGAEWDTEIIWRRLFLHDKPSVDLKFTDKVLRNDYSLDWKTEREPNPYLFFLKRMLSDSRLIEYIIDELKNDKIRRRYRCNWSGGYPWFYPYRLSDGAFLLDGRSAKAPDQSKYYVSLNNELYRKLINLAGVNGKVAVVQGGVVKEDEEHTIILSDKFVFKCFDYHFYFIYKNILFVIVHPYDGRSPFLAKMGEYKEGGCPVTDVTKIGEENIVLDDLSVTIPKSWFSEEDIEKLIGEAIDDKGRMILGLLDKFVSEK